MRRSKTPVVVAAAVVAAAVTAVAAVVAGDDKDSIQRWHWGGGGVNRGGAAFDGNGNGLWIGNCEAKMVIDTSGGGW